MKSIFDECKIKPVFRNRLDYDIGNSVELTNKELLFPASEEELEDVEPHILEAVFGVTKEEGEVIK